MNGKKEGLLGRVTQKPYTSTLPMRGWLSVVKRTMCPVRDLNPCYCRERDVSKDHKGSVIHF